jgi:hypothetical protein
MTQQEIDNRFYAANQIIKWLVDGYFINCVLSGYGTSRHITKEWIVGNYNVEMSYFEKK